MCGWKKQNFTEMDNNIKLRTKPKQRIDSLTLFVHGMNLTW